jgi:LmbE family N-acetylglucosaminyl deacetylase
VTQSPDRAPSEALPFRRALVLAPHTDDGEFGCGGTIARLVEERREVTYVAFSAAEKAVPAEFPGDVLRKEVREATAVLGIPQQRLQIANFEVRDFPHRRQELLDFMIRLREELRPDVVFLPSAHDVHQDHAQVHAEGLRAFKQTTMLGYEVPWNNLVFETTAFVRLTEGHLDRKIAALACYRSQAHRPYANEESLRAQARLRGTQAGCRFAETFQVIRWIAG